MARLDYNKVRAQEVHGSLGGGLVGSGSNEHAQLAKSLMDIAGVFGAIRNKSEEEANLAKGQEQMMNAVIAGKQKEVLTEAAEDEGKWYNKIWGTSAFYKGMQSMAATAATQTFKAEETEKLSRKVDKGGTADQHPDAYRKSLTERILASKTGDAKVDAELMANLLPVAETLAGHQATRHAEYANKTAAASFADTLGQATRAYDATVKNMGFTDRDRNLKVAPHRVELANIFSNTPEGMNAETASHMRAAMIVQRLKDNKGDLLEIAMSRNLLKSMTAQDRMLVSEAVVGYDKLTLGQLQIDQIQQTVRIGQFVDQGDTRGALQEVIAQQQAANERGDGEIGAMANYAQIAADSVKAAAHQKSVILNEEKRVREADARAARAAANALAYQEQKENLRAQKIVNGVMESAQALFAGRPNQVFTDDNGLPRVRTPQELQEGYFIVLASLAKKRNVDTDEISLTERIRESSKAPTVKDPEVANVLNVFNTARGVPLTRSTEQQLPRLEEILKAVRGDTSKLERYGVDKTTATNLEIFVDQISKGVPRNEAYNRTFGTPAGKEAVVSSKEISDAINRLTARNKLSPNGAYAHVAEANGGNIDSLRKGLTTEGLLVSKAYPWMGADQVAEATLTRLKNAGTDVVKDKRIMMVNPAAGRLFEQSGLGNPASADYAVEAIHLGAVELANKRGTTYDDFMIHQGYDGAYVYVPMLDGVAMTSQQLILSPEVMQAAQKRAIQRSMSKHPAIKAPAAPMTGAASGLARAFSRYTNADQ